jgi:outer membrane murein-binding lipoprotein Lpp
MYRVPIRRRLLVLAAAASVLLLLGGCGADSPKEQTAPRPKLSAALGAELADKAELVAIRLEASDEAGAKQLAEELRRVVEESIAAGAVPRALRLELTSSVRELEASIQVPAGPPPKKSEEKRKHGHEEGEEEHGHED